MSAVPAGRALVISPFATSPADAGQRRRALQTTRLLRDLGYQITFLHYAFEDLWYWRAQPQLAAEMRTEWGDVRHVYSRRQVSLPPANGPHHGLDEWWDETFGAYLKRLLEFEDFQIAVVHNVWLSKAFTLMPNRIVKILDTHDLFYLRNALSEKYNIANEFLSLSHATELDGLARAHVVLTIKAEEAALIAREPRLRAVVNIPYVSPPPLPDTPAAYSYHHPEKVVFGFLGSNHSFNQLGLQALLDALNRLIPVSLAPVELHIGGNICQSFPPDTAWFQPIRHGYVADEAAFYGQVDIALAPVFDGTGFKVKVADLAAQGMPFLCARHAAEGLAQPPARSFADAEEMARAMVEIAFSRPDLPGLSAQALAIDAAQRQAVQAAGGDLARAIAVGRQPLVFLLTAKRLDGSMVLQLVAAITHARTMLWAMQCQIILSAELGLDLDRLNATAALGLVFLALGSPAAAAALAAPNACIVLHEPGPATAPHLAGRAVSSRLIWDLRRRSARQAGPVHPWRAPDIAAFLVHHRQGEMLAGGRRGQEYFCAPLLGDEIFWDPSMSYILGVYAAAGATMPPTAGQMLVVDGPAALASARALAQAAGLRPSQFVDVSEPPELAGLIFRLLRRGPGPLEIIDALLGYDWLKALMEEAAALPGTGVRVRGLAQEFSSTVQPASHPQAPLAIAGREIFWTILNRPGALALKTEEVWRDVA